MRIEGGYGYPLQADDRAEEHLSLEEEDKQTQEIIDALVVSDEEGEE